MKSVKALQIRLFISLNGFNDIVFLCNRFSCSDFNDFIRGVARVPRALGKEIFLLLPPTKSTEFEVKSRCKNAEEATAIHLL